MNIISENNNGNDDNKAQTMTWLYCKVMAMGKNYDKNDNN
jgi:hypothetical protein